MKLSGNQLKIIALIAMTCDHVGKQIFPQAIILQIVGRLAYPIFAYMIAEGCRYTQNQRKYLGTMAGMALLCQLAYFLAMGSLYQCVFVTFTLSISLIYIIEYAAQRRTVTACLVLGGAFLVVYFICERLPEVLSYTDFYIDYGIWGVLLPVVVYTRKEKKTKLLAVFVILILLSLDLGGIQWYSLAAVGLLALYSGARGKGKLKNLFYIYYPLHLVIIYLVTI